MLLEVNGGYRAIIKITSVISTLFIERVEITEVIEALHM